MPRHVLKIYAQKCVVHISNIQYVHTVYVRNISKYNKMANFRFQLHIFFFRLTHIWKIYL